MVEVSYPGPPYVMEYMNAKIPVNVQTIDMIAPYSMVREILGTMIRNVLCQKFAPSRLADSRMEGDILVMPPRIMIACQPMENQVRQNTKTNKAEALLPSHSMARNSTPIFRRTRFTGPSSPKAMRNRYPMMTAEMICGT